VLKLLRVLTVSLTIIVASVALPQAANATVPATGVPLLWTNFSSGYCMGVAGGKVDATTNGKAIIEWRCNGSTDQQWISDTSPGNDQVLLRNGMNRSKCLSVAAMSPNAGAALVIWDCKEAATNADQRWTIWSLRLPNCNALGNANSGRLIGVQNHNPNEGAALVQTTTDLIDTSQTFCPSAP
jgi:hypothetical protein